MDDFIIAQTALDQMVGDERSQILKAALPYMSPKNQQFISVFTKVMELLNTLRLFSPQSQQITIQSKREIQSPLQFMEEILPYCFGQSKEQMEQMMQILQMVQISSELSNPQDE